jgi:hypothetical protein
VSPIVQRVEIPAYTDAWMSGDRYGILVKVTKTKARVKMDRSGRIRKFPRDDVQYVSTD